jgi:hypothetical protein
MRCFLILIVTCLLLSQTLVTAQLPNACNGTASAIACDITCISCNFNGFSGSTEGYPSGVAPEFCGTIENVQWLGFIAGAPQAKFIITPSNCINGDGLQVALYSDCMEPPLACDKGELGGGALSVAIDVDMLVGGNYYLLVDGYAGDQCQFTVTVDPPSAVFEPPLGVAQLLSGPTQLCPNVTAEFTVQPVSGASAYIWTGPPGTLFDSIPSPATILASDGLAVDVTIGGISGPICVQAANACNENPPCSASLDVMVLGDNARPQLVADTLVSLPCVAGSIPLQVEVFPGNNTSFQWSITDSIGSITGSTDVLNVLVDSVGQYTLLATDIFTRCTSEISIHVTEPVLPDSADIQIVGVRCYGEQNGSIAIPEVFSGTPPYVYALNGAPFRQFSIFDNLTAGTYDLVVQDALGCEFDTTLNISQPDELLVVLQADTSVELGEMLVLWDSSNVNYPQRPIQWQLMLPNIGDTTNCAGCFVMPIHSFKYTLAVMDANGCRALDDRTVVVQTLRRTYVPNVFMPDSEDSGNALFGPFGGPDVALFRTFQVFDRWGQLLHDRTALLPNDAQGFWDGRIANRAAPPGMYVYRLEVAYKDGEILRYEGDVTLVR